MLRILNIVMNLSMVSLALRGHCEHTVGDGECHGCNFLALVAIHTFTANAGSNREKI